MTKLSVITDIVLVKVGKIGKTKKSIHYPSCRIAYLDGSYRFFPEAAG
jgi:hypothetical protein